MGFYDTTKECYIPRRYNIIALTFLAITIAYMVRANLSIAILTMATEFKWQASNKGMYLSSFFWGYVATQLLGGMAARKFGTKITLLVAIVIPSILTLLIPIVAEKSEVLFVVCRVLTGAASGGIFPTAYGHIGGWVPFSEKSTALGIVFSGMNFGTIIVNVLGPRIMLHLGWQYVFYFSGASGLVWALLWLIFSASTPADMKSISPTEAKYIQDGHLHESDAKKRLLSDFELLNDPEEAKPQPVQLGNMQALKILCVHACFWNNVITFLFTSWGTYIFMAWLPTYAHEVLNFDIQMAGLVAIFPNISNTILSFGSGKVCDILLRKGYRVVVVRKIFFTIGCTLYGSTLVLLALKDKLGISNVIAAVILGIGAGGGGFYYPGREANIYDLAPYHASLVVGISNTAGAIPGIVGIYVTGIMLQAGMTWSTVFLIAASFYVLAIICHLIFCKVKRLV